MKKTFGFILWIIGVSGFLLFYHLYPVYFPESKAIFNIQENQAKENAIEELLNLNYDTTNYVFFAYLKLDLELSKNLVNVYGFQKATEIINRYSYAYYDISGYNLSDEKNARRISDDREEFSNFLKQPLFRLRLNTDGQLIYLKIIKPDTFRFKTKDSTLLESKFISIIRKYYSRMGNIINSENIKQIKEKEITRFNGFGLNNEKDSIFFESIIQNNMISQIRIFSKAEMGQSGFKKGDENILLKILNPVIILIFIILIIIMVVRGYKNDELNFKFSFIFSIIITFGFVIYFYTAFFFSDRFYLSWYEFLIPLLFILLIFGAFSLIVFLGSESSLRLFDKTKFYSFDALKNKKLNYRRTGNSFINSIALSGAALIIPLSFYASINIFNVNISNYYPKGGLFEQPLNFILSSPFSGIGSIFYNFYVQVLFIFGGICFVPSLLKLKISNKYFVFLISLFILTLVNLPFSFKFSEIYVNLMHSLVFSCFILLVFNYFDFLTVILTCLFSEIFINMVIFKNIENENSTTNFYIIALVFSLYLIVGIFSFLFSRKKTDYMVNYDELAPRHIKRITERDRIQKEIDAARHIQKSFLPASSPDFEGLDVSALCIPAYEVGGDYYDYFNIDKKKLGVVIGDVSGKGIKAAFYMTLIKGIIKAQSLSYTSPKEVVLKLNKLLCEIIEKGNFVSLVYGVFDKELNTFRFCNAGHNPIIYKNSTTGSIKYFSSSGMALGLNNEEIFSDHTSEQIINLRAGDLIILYTDGITEAMNKSHVEYGEKKFLDLMTACSNNTPQSIIDLTRQAMKDYIGRSEQHDDMTIVVIRIK